MGVIATLPTKDSLGPLPAARTGRAIARINTSVADTRAVSRSAATLGNAIAKFGGSLGDIGDKADEFETERRYQEFKWNETQGLDKLMREVQPGQAGGFAESWANGYTEKAKAFFETVPEYLKPKYDAKLFDAERDFYDSAATFGRSEQKRSSIAAVDEHKDRLATTGDIDKAKADYDGLLNANPYLTPIEKDEIRRRGLGDLEEGYILWRLERGDDIDGLIKELEHPVPPLGRTKPTSAIERQDDGFATVRTGTGAGFRVAGDYADRFAGALSELEAAGINIDGAQSGGYADRNIRGTRTPSQHKFGRAIDVNWNENAQDTEGSIDPELARSIAKKWGLKWGGDWKGKQRDPMHFEVDDDADFKAPAVAERGLTKYAGLESKETASDAGGAALPGGEARSRYEYLDPQKRASLLHAAKSARDTKQQERLWDFKQQIEDDVESIRKTGQGRANIELDAIRKTVDPSVWNNYVNARREASMEYDGGRDIESMDDRRISSHLISLAPEAGSADYEMKADVYAKVKAKADKIRELRKDDPAAAVNEFPEVKQAAKGLEEQRDFAEYADDPLAKAAAQKAFGNTKPMERFIKARLDAQARIGISEQDRLPITKAEAKALLDLPAQRWNMNEKDYQDKLRSAADKAEETYGPLMARQVFETAIGLDLKDKTGTDAAAGIIAKIAKNEVVTPDDFRRMTALQDIDRVSRTFNATLRPDMEEDGSRPAISPNYGRDAMDFTTRYAAEEAGRKPNASQEQWVRDNPDQHGVFDMKFGNGAAARALAKKQGKPAR